MLRRVFRLPWSIRRVEREVDEELRFHLESRVADLVARGYDPDEARGIAEREFGDLDASRDELAAVDRRRVRRARGAEFADALRQDLSYALRGIRRQPGFAATIVVALALAVGVNAAVFSLIDPLLFRPPA